ncbi:MAG TPA: TIM barrel protein [Verrucomicrobiae bacterium]
MTRVFTFALLLVASISARAAEYSLFARSNLVAWCIVPFDAKKRGPEERAQMLDRLGIHKFAYDWRAEHIPTFEEEIDTCRKHNIEIIAWWFPTTLDKDAQTILALLKRKNLHPQLWVMGGGEPTKSAEEQQKRVESEVARLRPIADAAAAIGCKVGLYNHGGWFGEPENQLAIIKALKAPNVGIVYNFHHGHDQIERFPELFAKMKPHLYCININGMLKDGERIGKKILTIGEGDQELAMLKVIEKSDWRGPIGILNHRPEMDAEEALRNNVEGLERLKRVAPLR